MSTNHDHKGQTTEDPEETTFRALLSAEDFSSLETFRLDIYGNGVDAIASGDSIPCRYLDPVSDAAADAVGHRSLGGSDYSGGSLIRSNLKAFRALVEEETGEGEPLPIIDYYGGHGTDGVLILLDRKGPRDSLAPFVELLRGLEDYPVVCDDTMSEVEHEEEDTAWKDGAEGDFSKALAGYFGQDTEVEDRNPDVYPNATTLRELFHSIADSANLEGGSGVVHEETGPYFLVEDAAASVSPVLLFALGLVKLDPDTMLDLASSTDTDDHDDARRIRRISRLGVALNYIRGYLVQDITKKTVERKSVNLEGKTLSVKAQEAIKGEAERIAVEMILKADIDAGDAFAPIDAGLGLRQRWATVTLSRFVTWGPPSKWRTVDVTLYLDPESPYNIDRHAIRDFVARV